jgi:trans-aconitate methyltransferase
VEHHKLKSWQDRNFALDWVSSDALGAFLELPRRLSAEVLAQTRDDVALVIDIASGPGAFLEVFLEEFPGAHAVWVDASEVMQEQARKRLARFADRVEYRMVDMTDLAAGDLPVGADAVITSRATHHLSPDQLLRLYRDVVALLAPGGWMANLDHTAPGDPWLELFKAVKPRFLGPTPAKTGHTHTRPLPTVADQISALNGAGFCDVAIPWKSFQTVLLMARKRYGLT